MLVQANLEFESPAENQLRRLDTAKVMGETTVHHLMPHDKLVFDGDHGDHLTHEIETIRPDTAGHERAVITLRDPSGGLLEKRSLNLGYLQRQVKVGRRWRLAA